MVDEWTWKGHKDYHVARIPGYMLILGTFGSGWLASLHNVRKMGFTIVGRVTFDMCEENEAKEYAIRMLGSNVE